MERWVQLHAERLVHVMARRAEELGSVRALTHGMARMMDFRGALHNRVPTADADEDLSLAWAAIADTLPEPPGSEQASADSGLATAPGDDAGLPGARTSSVTRGRPD